VTTTDLPVPFIVILFVGPMEVVLGGVGVVGLGIRVGRGIEWGRTGRLKGVKDNSMVAAS
jgi:hypothetical protein